jgi:biofilm PGA synthesis protein PgaA
VHLARDRRFAEAIEGLSRILAAAPDDVVTRADLAAVLHWAGRDAEALEAGAPVPIDSLPVYSLEALGRASRNVGRHEDALRYYAAALAREPARVESGIGHALALVEADRSAEALPRIRALLTEHPDSVDVVMAAAQVHRALDDAVESAALLRRVVELDPEHAEALRLEVLLLGEIGAAFLAARRAEARPDLFSADELASLRAERAATAVRFSEVAPRNPDERYVALDRALALLDGAIAEAPADAGYALERSRFDRVVALAARNRMSDVVREVDALEAEGVELPPYVLLVAGDAHLTLRDPERARELFLRSLSAWPESVEGRIGLFYAMVECEDFGAAFAVIDSLVAEEPAWRYPPEPRGARENPYRVDAEVTAALGRAFAGLLPEAQVRLEALSALAPMNAGVRQELGSVYLWRGWPRRAEAEFQLVLAVDPDHTGARIGMASTHLDLFELGPADRILEGLVADAPEHVHVRRLQARRRNAGAWQLTVDARTGRSTGGELGTRDRGIETFLISAPIYDRVRAFLRTTYADARLPDSLASHDKVGAGVEVWTRPLRMSIEVARDRRGGDGIGGTLEADVRLSDTRTARLGYEHLTTAVPLQAVLLDLDGWRARGGYEHRWSERRRASLDLGWMEMTDGNRRASGYAALEERLFTGPHTRLSGLLEFYGATSSRDDAPYFNPRRTLAPTLTGIGEWITYRRYETSFVQRLSLSGGTLWQQGFGSEPTAAVEYTHEWALRTRLGLRYGVRWSRPVYDGLSERSTRFHAGFDWRIR